MTETRRTSFFALLFFIYFIGVSFLMAYLPLASRLSDSAYMLLSQLICFVPPLLVYFKWSKKNVKETLRLNPLGWKNLLLLLSFGISIQPLMSLLSYLTALFFPNPVEQSVGGHPVLRFLVSFVRLRFCLRCLRNAFRAASCSPDIIFWGNIRHSLPAHCFLVCCI